MLRRRMPSVKLDEKGSLQGTMQNKTNRPERESMEQDV
jgi:hypothetical protein